MAKFWFVSAPLVSHTDWGGFLQTAQELKERGHEVLWISTREVEKWVRGKGLDFRPIADTGWLWPLPAPPDFSTLSPMEATRLRYTRAIDTWLTVDRVMEGTRALLHLADEIDGPDVIASDPFLSAPALAAEALDVPIVMCGWPAQAELDETQLFNVQRELGSESRTRIGQLCEFFGLKGRNFSSGPTPSIVSPDLHICYFTRSWYLAEDDTLLGQNRFVGGRLNQRALPAPQWLNDIPHNQPLGLITLGTIFTGDLGFYSWAAHAVAQEGLLPVVAIGWNPIEKADKDALVRSLPKGTHLLNWVPFEHVLPRSRIAIHHGGMGTTHHIVVHGVPQIVVPHAADQRVQAKRVAQAKVGIQLSAHDVRQGMLKMGVKALLDDPQVAQNAQVLASDMAECGGTSVAAKYLESLVPVSRGRLD